LNLFLLTRDLPGRREQKALSQIKRGEKEMTYPVSTIRFIKSARAIALSFAVLWMLQSPSGLWAQAGSGTTQGDNIAERVESQETNSSDQDKLVKEISEAAKKAGQDHPNDADAVKKDVKDKIDEIIKRKSSGNKPGGDSNKEVKEWAKKLKRELLDKNLIETAAAATPGETQGEKIAERVEAQETNSSDQDQLVKEIAKAAREAGKANPNDPQKVKDAVKAKLDEIRDRASTPGKPGGARNSEVEEWVKKLKRTLMQTSYVSVTPANGSRILLTGTVVEGQKATLSVVDANGAALEGVVVDINDARYVSDNHGRVVFVAAGVAGTVVASLPALREAQPAEAQVVSAFNNVPVQPAMESAPRHVLAGDQAAITGSGFDGDAAANTVKLDGQDVPVLASSPSEVVIDVPQDTALGSHDVVVETPQGATEPRRMNVIRLGVQADSAVLMRGKRGKLQVTVSGTDEAVPLRVVNQTPQIITLADGDASQVTTSGGRDNHVTLKARGENPGAFRITAEIVEDAPAR
jgi:IPT/TIG domain